MRDPVVFAWLEDASKSGHRDATLTLAALLAAGPESARRDPERALGLLKDAKWNFDFDPTAQEVIAAAHAQQKDFAEAASAQKRAVGLARRYDWNLAPQQDRLARYEAGTEWTGYLLAD